MSVNCLLRLVVRSADPLRAPGSFRILSLSQQPDVVVGMWERQSVLQIQRRYSTDRQRRHQKRYSVSDNATLRFLGISQSFSNDRSGLLEIVIASNIYRSSLIENHYYFFQLSLQGKKLLSLLITTPGFFPLWSEPDWPHTLTSAVNGVGDSCIIKGRQHERYSVIAITLHHIFSLSHNASILWRKVIAFYRYRSRLMGIVIVSIVIALAPVEKLSLFIVFALRI